MFGFRCTGAKGLHVPRNADAELFSMNVFTFLISAITALPVSAPVIVLGFLAEVGVFRRLALSCVKGAMVES